MHQLFASYKLTMVEFILGSKTQDLDPTCLRLTLKYIKQVVRALEGNLPLDDLNAGLTPGYSSFHCRYGSSDTDTSPYSEDLNKFRKMASESLEQGSRTCTLPKSTSDPRTYDSSFEGQQTYKEVEMEKQKENIQNSGENS